jgi:predicted DNA-binding transcriptional regulator YafY
MRRADRLFQLVQLLRTRRASTGQDLADHLGVSLRTVYRDIRDLEYSGVPIRGEAGVGYRLDQGYELPPLTFSGAEIEGLVLGARMVATWADAELAEAVRSAMTKIEAVVPEGLRRVVLETALVAPDFPRTQEVSRDVDLMRRAIGERRLLDFAYVRADGEASERKVRPLGLYFWGNRWTLAAWCEMRRDYRSFRPDRMTDVVVLDDRFDPGDGINLAQFLARVEEPSPREHQAEHQPAMRSPSDGAPGA